MRTRNIIACPLLPLCAIFLIHLCAELRLSSKSPNYFRVLEEHLKNITISPGAAHHVEILHDDWCGVFEGYLCNCEPTVASGPLVDAKYEGEDEA